MPYSIFQPAISPGFLRQPYGAAWASALGSIKDLMSNNLKQGIQQRWVTLAQAEAIAAIGAERGIPQGSTESLETYIASILNAWGAWQLAGTPWSILGLLNFLGYPDAYLVTQNGNVWGPSGDVVLPNPVTDLAGVAPSVSVGNRWTFTVGSGQAGQQGFYSPTDGYWEPSTSYIAHSIISPNPPNGLFYRSGTGTHTSGSTPPVWPGTGSVSDGGVTWSVFSPADLAPVGQFQGTVSVSFWSAYIIVLTPLPSGWNQIENPPTTSSNPSIYTMSSISALLTAFGAGHATCCGFLIAPTSASRATFGWPGGRTFYGDAGYSAPSSSADGLTKFWIPHETGVVVGQNVIPTNPNGYLYTCSAKTTGTTGYAQPSWPTTTGNTVTDSGVTWECVGPASTYITGTSQEVTTFAFVPTVLQ